MATDLIGSYITVYNDRGAQYRGILKAILHNGDIMVKVEAIRLTGRLVDGQWQELRKAETQRITGPRDIVQEDQHGIR